MVILVVTSYYFNSLVGCCGTSIVNNCFSTFLCSAEISFETLPTPMPMDYDSDWGHLPPIADPSPSDEEEDSILPQPTELSDTEDIPSDRPAWSTVDGGSQKRKEKLLDGLG